jgi:hypothetical protein
LLECRDGGVALAEPVANGAEREPRRGKARRQLDGLQQNVGRAAKIAARRLIQRPFVTPVGSKISGGNKQRGAVAHHTSFRGRAERRIRNP